ncbi:MAG TPA: glycosyltransferase family 39 protein [Planctomycetota bacterium]|nr:glycosyltransferase family 39 protein [Planctomycetota bacterium]
MKQSRTLRACALLLVLLVGFALRARHLSRSLGLDEHGTLWAVRGDAMADSVRRVEAVQGESPLYYLIVRATLAVTGESEARLRLPSLLAGSLVPLLGYFAAARAFGRRAGAAALVLLAFEPALVFESENARPYALAHAFTLLSALGLSRALETGALRDRVLAWGGAVLAIYAHYVFAPLGPAIVIGALASERRVYASRRALVDAAVSFVLLIPAWRDMAALLARRNELAWVEVFSLAPIGSLLPPIVRYVVGVAVVVTVLRVSRPWKGRGLLVFAGMNGALVAAALLVLYCIGSNILDQRYVAVGAATVPLASAWAIAGMPRAAGALALALVAALGVRAHDTREVKDPLEWREVRVALDAEHPTPAEPVLFWSGYIEHHLLLKKGRVGPEVGAFLVAPIEDVPGFPETSRRFVPLTYLRGSPEAQLGYYESSLFFEIADAHRFFIIAHPSYRGELDRWIQTRFRGRFRLTHLSRVYTAPVVLAVYEG